MNTKKDSVNDRMLKLHINVPKTAEQFEVRLGVLRYVAHANQAVSIADIQTAETDKSAPLIRGYLTDLLKLGYVEKESIWTYVATEKARQLFGVK